MTEPLVLRGLDGSNPLGFLAGLGAALTAQTFAPQLKLGWHVHDGAWRPCLTDCDSGAGEFSRRLYRAFGTLDRRAFEVEKKLPFEAALFAKAMRSSCDESSVHDRRWCDLLAALGTEIHHENGIFADTAWRMVRSGDSAGQGLPAYALAIFNALDEPGLRRSLFETWDYLDDGFSLRWDPLEDQRYALRFDNPSTSRDRNAPKTMLGANALALQAISLFPVQPTSDRAATTGFFKVRRKPDVLTWPIWNSALSLPTIRSLLSHPGLHQPRPERKKLFACGVMEIYRSERIAQNQYYRNFTPAVPA